jgi:hypothetical protein
MGNVSPKQKDFDWRMETKGNVTPAGCRKWLHERGNVENEGNVTPEG